MAEWLKAADSKSAEDIKSSAGSNPVLSASWEIPLLACLEAESEKNDFKFFIRFAEL